MGVTYEGSQTISMMTPSPPGLLTAQGLSSRLGGIETLRFT